MVDEMEQPMGRVSMSGLVCQLVFPTAKGKALEIRLEQVRLLEESPDVQHHNRSGRSPS